MKCTQMIHIGLLDEEAAELVSLIGNAINDGETLSESLLDLRKQLKRVLKQRKQFREWLKELPDY